MRKDLIDEVINSPKVDAQLDRLSERLKGIVGLIDVINQKGKNINFAKGMSESTRAAQEARAATEQLRKEREALRNQEQELKNVMQQVRVEVEKERLSRARLTTEEAKARAEKRKLKDSIVAEKGSVIQLNNSLKELIAQYDRLGPASRKALAGQQLLRNIKATREELQKLKNETGRFQDNVGNYPRFVGGVTGFLGAFGVATGGSMIAKQVFDTTVQLDSLNAALKAVSGTEAEYAKNQQFLLDTSERLGLNILDLTQSYKLFYAASTQSGLSADTTRKIFNSVAESAAVLKLSTQDTQGVLLAFSQILGKGKVQAEELRGQIGERIPGAFAIAARSIGVTEQQLNKMLEKGEVIASEFLPKFAAELEKTFGVEGNQRVEGLQASINRLSNTFTKLVSDNQTGLGRFFSALIDGATKALTTLGELADKAGELYDFIQKVGSTGLAPVGKRGGIGGTNDELDEFIKKAREVHAGKDVTQLLNILNKVNLAIRGATPDRVPLESLNQLFAEQKVLQELIDSQLLPAPPNTGSTTPSLTKEQENAAARLRERQRKALLDAANIDLQTAIDSQKEIFENEKANFQDRLDALALYYDLREQQINENLAGEKKKEKLLPEEITLLEKKADAERIKNRKEFWKEYVDVVKSGADEATKAILAASEEQNRKISEAEDVELAKETERFQKGIYSEEQYELAKLQVTNKYINLRLQAEIDVAKKLLEIRKRAGLPIEEQLKQINDLENQLRDENLKYYEDIEKRKTDTTQKELEKRRELEQQYHDRIVQLRQDALGLATEIGLSFFEREKNRLQEQIDLIDEQREREVDAVNNSVQNAEEREARISAINQTAQIKKEAIERRQREVDARAAQFQKLASLFQIGITTAETIFKIQAQAAILSSNPLTAALASLAYSQIPLVIASAGLQAAAIAAKPIPKYAEGTDDHPGGPAIVGDGYRHEVVVNPDGSIGITPDKPTYMNLPKHAQVIPSIEEFLMSHKGMFLPPYIQPEDRAIGDRAMAQEIVNGVEKSMRKVEKAIMSRPSERTIITEAGMQHQVWSATGWNTYINKYVKHKD